MLGSSIQLVHTQVLGQRCGVLMEFLPFLYKFADECTACHDLISESCKILTVRECPIMIDAKVSGFGLKV